jgi:putative membrane protein
VYPHPTERAAERWLSGDRATRSASWVRRKAVVVRLGFPEESSMIVLFAFLHHLAAFTLVAAIALEFVLLRGELTVWSARRLQVADMVLGMAAAVLLAVGLARVVWFEKGAAYYFSSHAFLTKFALFIIVGILSVVPTIEFLSWRKAVEAGQVPVVAAGKLRRIRMIVHIELAAIVVILLCAAIMAKGGWI